MPIKVSSGTPEVVRSFERGLRVIRSFGSRSPAMSLSDVARAAGLTRATARRLLHTLETLGYAQQSSGRFSLTPRVLELGHAFMSSYGIHELVLPYLESVTAALNESSSVAMLDGSEIVYIARVPARRVMTVHIGLGTRFPAYRTSLGRVIMADLSDEELEQIWEATDRSHPTSSTVTTLSELRQRLDEARNLGWALLDQELEDGVRAVAAPIRNSRGQVVAAMSISTHASRTSRDEIVARFVPVLLNAASAASPAFSNLSRQGVYGSGEPSFAPRSSHH